MRTLLEEAYRELMKLININESENRYSINLVIKNALSQFMKQCNRPAIWCYGQHTKMLMADFMFELKKIHYIIDNGVEDREGEGFELIVETQIQEKKIDGIIISSWNYRNEIKNRLRENFPQVYYLDIYEELEKVGIYLGRNYYEGEHPYSRYRIINQLQQDINRESDERKKQEKIKKIIIEFIRMKDFCTAKKYINEMPKMSGDIWGDRVSKHLQRIYCLQKEAMEKIDENNVVMLCIDGLQQKNINKGNMRNLYGYLKKNTFWLKHAYAVSTSTYESLIPAYSENADMQTRYYEKNEIAGENCRFIKRAKEQKRKIFFYTDGIQYIKDEDIKVTEWSQTASEKLWEFLLDAVDEKNGLFYIHILYESHYSYPNPYTEGELITDGMNIMFDYLKKNGGQMRTDYDKQQKDALRYLDDILPTLLERLKCRMVLYADHGNILIGLDERLSDVEETKYTFHEDLLRVPLAVKSPEMEIKTEGLLVSIMELNRILLGLLNKEKIIFEKKKFIKAQRSAVYNPDFQFLYKQVGYEHDLLAFEVFIFEEGYKLAVYSDGKVEVYLAETDEQLDESYIEKKLFNQVKDEITVY